LVQFTKTVCGSSRIDIKPQAKITVLADPREHIPTSKEGKIWKKPFGSPVWEEF
jgi:hypothetical protein